MAAFRVNRRPKDDTSDDEMDKSNLIRPPPKIHELKYIKMLGKGQFAEVFLMEDIADNNTPKRRFALKIMKKQTIIEIELEKHIKQEKDVMLKMNHKFLVNLHETYNDPNGKYVYLLLDACLGGDLFTILKKRRLFTEATTKFYAASVIEAFAYMHSRSIIYRDMKPENLVLDINGYVKVIDFGFAKELKTDASKTYTLVGSPDYLSPEIITGQGHDKGADWWTLGILIYEMMASFPPFVADDPIQTYRKIIRSRFKFPQFFTLESRDLIRGLLKNQSEKRLGVIKKYGKIKSNDPIDLIRNHPWFKGFDWNALNNGTMDAPIKDIGIPQIDNDQIEFEWIPWNEKEKETLIIIDCWYRKTISTESSIKGINNIIIQFFMDDNVNKDDLALHFESIWKDGKRIL